MLLSALHEDLYVEGVSVVAHRVMDLTGADAFFLLVEMEDRIFVTARSRGGRVDVAAALRAVGGGGHTAAASAVVKDTPLDDVAAAVAAAVPDAVAPTRVARDALEAGPPVRPDTAPSTRPPCCAAATALGGVGVLRRRRLVGRWRWRDLDRAVRPRAGPRPGQGRDDGGACRWCGRTTPLDRVALRLAQDEVGWLPVVTARPAGDVAEAVELSE